MTNLALVYVRTAVLNSTCYGTRWRVVCMYVAVLVQVYVTCAGACSGSTGADRRTRSMSGSARRSQFYFISVTCAPVNKRMRMSTVLQYSLGVGRSRPTYALHVRFRSYGTRRVHCGARSLAPASASAFCGDAAAATLRALQQRELCARAVPARTRKNLCLGQSTARVSGMRTCMCVQRWVVGGSFGCEGPINQHRCPSQFYRTPLAPYPKFLPQSTPTTTRGVGWTFGS